jgi:putative membrane protein
MSRQVALIGASLLLVAGCRNSHWREQDPRVDSTPIPPTTNYSQNSQTSQNRLPAMDADFLRKAAWGNQAEVQFGRVAVERGTDEKVRTFGQRMIDDHGRMLGEIKDLASRRGMTLSDQLPAEAQADLNHLSAMSGQEFDREYVRMMVKDHQEDLDAFDREARTGVDSDVKALAARSLPTIREHLRMVNDMEVAMTAPKLGTLPHNRPPTTRPEDLPGNAPPMPGDPNNPERPSSLPGTPDTPNPRPVNPLPEKPR